jgi:L-fucose isomerase-like protein
VRPKIGLIAVGRAPWLRTELVEELKNLALTGLKKLPADLVVADGIPFKLDEVWEATRLMKKEDVDAVVLFHANWTYGEIYCLLGKELFEYPIIQWGMYKTPGATNVGIPLPGLLESYGDMIRLGKKTFFVIGSPIEDQVIDQIGKLVNACTAIKKLRRSRLGVAGGQNLGQTDTTYSEFHMRNIVPALLHLDMLEVLQELRRVDENEARSIAESVIKKVGRVEVGEEHVLGAAKAYLAIREVVKKHKLDAITLREWPEAPIENFTMSLANALLDEQGIPCVSECDIPSTILWLVYRALSEDPVWLCEFEWVDDVEKNTAILQHNCEAPFRLAKSLKDITITYTGFVEWFGGRKGGANIQLELKPGKVTIAKIDGRPINGRIRAMITTGHIDASPYPPVDGVSRGYIKFDCSVKELVDTWVTRGFGHHVVLSYGDHKDELAAIFDLMNLDTTVM